MSTKRFESFQVWATRFVAAVLAGAFLLLLLADLRNGWIALDSMRWLKAPGKVVEVKVDKQGNRYVAGVKYEFKVNGEQYCGHRYGMLQHDGTRHFKTRDRAEAWAQIGEPLVVRYHQADPNQNIVINSVPAWLLFVFVKTMLVGLLALYLWPTKAA